jgi:hypothetical protein
MSGSSHRSVTRAPRSDGHYSAAPRAVGVELGDHDVQKLPDEQQRNAHDHGVAQLYIT